MSEESPAYGKPPRVVALLHTEDFRGDHAADVEIAVEQRDGETVEAFARRLLVRGNEVRAVDWITLRLVRQDDAAEAKKS